MRCFRTYCLFRRADRVRPTWVRVGGGRHGGRRRRAVRRSQPVAVAVVFPILHLQDLPGNPERSDELTAVQYAQGRLPTPAAPGEYCIRGDRAHQTATAAAERGRSAPERGERGEG